MERHPVDYAATGRFTPLVLDYLAAAPELRELHAFEPSRSGLQAAIKGRTFQPAMRALLCEVLEEQYRDLPEDPAVRRNLDALREEGTLTVSTGHQLCLFTGPLYVPFKILNVIRLARSLSEDRQHVVPVFWLATEDHDRAEIDHATVSGTKVQWPGASAAAVGGLKLDGIEATVAEVERLLGGAPHATEVLSLIRSCYRADRTLAQATRAFVHALFGRYGLVVIDGDDAPLKRAFVPVMQEELLNEVTARTVRYANERIPERHGAQAHVRDINLFHLRPGHRSRIERDGDRFRVLDGGPSFTMDELLRELEARPQDFSPNVLLRPIYQETVLPNIAYIGGGGEVAYWLQLRWLFQGLRIPMPVVLLRTSAMLLSSKDLDRWVALGLEPVDLFAPADELRSRVAVSNAGFSTDLARERGDLHDLYDQLAVRVREVDATLEGSVRSAAQAALKGLDHVEERLVRAAKRQQETALQRLDAVFSRAFPDGTLQERRDNFLPWYAAQGPAFLDDLLRALDPLDPRFSVLVG